jgi:peptide/nickel transport system ATP-binding protein
MAEPVAAIARDADAVPLLAGSGLTRSFEVRQGPFRRRWLWAVRGVDITVARGEMVAVVGESGCGKSTLARMLLGLLPPSAGEIRIDGETPARLGRRGIARLVQPVFQDPAMALNPRRRVGDIIGLPLRVQRLGSRTDRAEQVVAAMRQMGLTPALADRYPGQLSGGQRQRVAIARALIAQPKVLVCDEPTSALDVSVQAQILNLLQDLRAELHLGMVLISHNLAVVEHIADRVVIMYLGQVVERALPAPHCAARAIPTAIACAVRCWRPSRVSACRRTMPTTACPIRTQCRRAVPFIRAVRARPRCAAVKPRIWPPALPVPSPATIRSPRPRGSTRNDRTCRPECL